MSKYDKYVKEKKLNNTSTSKVSTSKTTAVSKYSKYKDSSVTQKVEDKPIVQKPIVKPTVNQDTTLTDAYAKIANTNQFANDTLSQSPTIKKINNLPSKELTNKEMFKDEPSRKIPIIGKVLQALDSISSNKAVRTVGEVGRAFYTPGGTVSNIAGFTGALGRKSAELLPNVAKSLAGNVAGRVTQTALKESTVGFPLGVGQYQSTGGDNTKEALKSGALGAAFGGGLGALGGSAGELISSIKKDRLAASFDKMFPAYEQAAKNRNVIDIGEIKSPQFNKTGDPSLSLGDDALNNVAPSKYSAEREAIKQAEPIKVDPVIKDATVNAERAIITPIVEPPIKIAEPEVIKTIDPIKTELQSKLDELEKDYQTKKSLISTGGLHPDDKVKKLKGLAMEHSAKKREATQGELLIPIDGGLTAKELTNKVNKLKSNYAGKGVIVDGQEGVVKNVAFGKVTVEFPDGTKKAYAPDLVTPKVDVDAIIKKQMEPVIVPKVEPIPVESTKIAPPKLVEPPKVEPVTPKPKLVVKPFAADDVPVIQSVKEFNTAPKSKYAEEHARINEVKPTGEKERGFVKTIKESAKTPEEVKTTIKGRYTPLSNKISVGLANKRVSKDLESSASYVTGKSQFSAEKVATAHRVIDEFNKSGNFQRSVDIAESIAKEGTAAGQGSQAFAIYNRLTSEGILVHAQRIVAKTNEKLSVIQKDVVLTAEMAENLVDLTNTNRAMMGVKDLSNNVMDILERAKSGKKLNAEDSEALLKFVNESKQFIKEVEKKPAIKPPTVVKDKRIKDSVIKFLDKQEEAAKERLRARGHRISSMPLDIYADYAIIGAAKMARGAIKFPEWSASMIKDLGEEIRPMLESIYNRSSETMNQSAKKVTKTSVSNAEKIVNKLIKDKKITGEEADYIKTLAEKVSDLSGYAKNIASQDLQFILRKLEKPTLLQKVSSTQTIGMLLNPKTQVRNALGNELFYRLERINKLATTPLDWLRVELFGGKRSVTFRTNNQGEYWKSWLMGLKAGWRGVNVEGLQTQFDLGPAAFSAKWNPLTYMEKALGASLKSFDTAAYKRAANNTIGELATLRAMNEGLTGEAKKLAIQKYIRNVDDHVLQVADDYGKYMTFQDNNLISTGLVKLKRGMNLGKDFGMGDLILKFPKTPGALLMRALEYSPAGFLRSASIAAKPFFKKDPNTAEAMQALTRAIVGTGGLSGLGWYLMDAGILTGAASKDKDVRDLQRTAGQGQYQVNLSALSRWARSGFDPEEAQLKEGDTLSTYDWMQPVAIAVSLGAEAGKSIEQNKSKGQAAVGLLGSAYSSIEGGVNSLVETSVLSGLKRATTSYPGQSISDKIVDILGSAPASFIPTSVNQYKQLTDNAQRETYDPSKLEQIFNQLKVKIPGVASQLPQRYDTLGSKKTTYQNNSIFNVLFNPSFVSKYKLTPEAKMVVKLISDTGDLSAAPRVPSKNITVYGDNGESSTQKLTTEQFVELQRRTGEETVRLLKLIPNNFTNEQKLRAIADMLTDAGKKARYDLKQGMGVR